MGKKVTREMGLLVALILFASAVYANVPLQCKQALALSKRVALYDQNFCTRLIQKKLNEKYDAQLVVDGRFGAEMEKAVKNFQIKEKMDDTGNLRLKELEILFPPEQRRD